MDKYLLENIGVYELTWKEAIGDYYCDAKKYNEKAIVSYFKTNTNEIIKTVLTTDHWCDGTCYDFLEMFFTNSNNVKEKECIEAAVRGLTLQLNDNRTNLIRRTNTQELIVKTDYAEPHEYDNKFEDVLKKTSSFEYLGYEPLKRGNVRSGCMTKYEGEKLLKEPGKVEKLFYGKKLYENNRDEYLSWDEFFMASAKLCALRSKDPSTQVGACIVGEDNVILSLGYNGAPNGWADEKFPWSKTGEYHDTKYPLVVHAEANAILHCVGAGKDLKNSRIYVDLFPCNQCAQLIAQSGIKEVIYLCDKYVDTDAVIASKRLFDNCGITYRQLVPNKEITLKLKL